jgi:hypothetical protein
VASSGYVVLTHPWRANVVLKKWIFMHIHADGTLVRYKARQVLRGFTQ